MAEGASVDEAKDAPACAADAASDGDYVVLWGSYTQIFGVVLQTGAITNNRFGNFHHDDLIGRSYGSKVRPRRGGQWLALLRPNPELVTQSLVHRTQIIYHADISLLLVLLDAQPGRVICEAGTGSGSVSTSFARALRPGGKLFTFEFHQDRQRQAVADFDRYGLLDTIVSQHGDVCKQGFANVPDGGVDGIFLDLPMPWLAIPHADKCLAHGGRIVSFSPCIEQIDKTAVEFRRDGRYYDVRMFETLAGNWGVRAEAPAKKRRAVVSSALAGNEADPSSSAGSAIAVDGSGKPQEQPTWLSYQMQMRSHTGYLLVATRSPADERLASESRGSRVSTC
mmetsp:Transcript_132042/g.422504  ORF Transcript_132042/g.422504 Transcript_132042/m.422504 type:complete len:338 (+) Transcript_132042:83-1096(+)